ncbi:hypothetical protein ACFLYC_01195 [Chloroflexota bacterium]
MTRPRKLWIAVGLFCALFFASLGFWLWTQFGYERTIIIYEAEQAPLVRSAIPGGAPAEESEFALATGIPYWFLPVRWGTIALIVVVAIYIVYLEIIYRRQQRAHT